MDRELGTSTLPCPTCDRELAVVVLQDGATSTVRCSHCYPETIVELARKVEPLPREKGIDEEEEESDD